MRESNSLPPEVELAEKASLYKIIPYNNSREKLISFYNDKATLRWSLNKWNIELWLLEDGTHADVDPDGYRAGTTGYIDKRRGITYSDSRLFDYEKKAEVVFALKKYLTT